MAGKAKPAGKAPKSEVKAAKAARKKGLPAGVKYAATAAAGVLLATSVWVGFQWVKTPAETAPVIEVHVPRGASIKMAANRLEAAGAISNARVFEILARILGDSRAIQYGTYGVQVGEGVRSILERMKNGDTLTVRITIPEGLPSILVAERLNGIERLQGTADVPAEGSVLPATYEIKVGDDRAAALAQMQKAMENELDRLWQARSPAAVVKSKEEAIILASVVEKESGVPSERKRIAGLYSNRIRIGMPLQADPTVIYPITKGKPLGRRILRSELQADNGYNTYRRAGLPAGPITNPGRESIEAVLNPEQHAYLFMVADGSGGHAFAVDYAGHQKNVAQWRAFRREKGI